MWLKKWKFMLIFLICSFIAHSQSRFIDFRNIDWEVQYIDALTPDSLAFKLTSPYRTGLEKVRAIFGWVTQNISYNTGILNPVRNRIFDNRADTATEWKSADEMTACQVLRRRVAVCEGYARLFKTLCHYAGIRSEVINGYARCSPGPLRFGTNHSWNAVLIDSAWYLVDATWGSGYLDQSARFVQQTDESYFLTRPEHFVHDHFPDDIRWTLLTDIPMLNEFKHAPYKTRSFVKYSIGSITPSKGIIEACIDDTVSIEMEIRNGERDEKISPDPFFDSTILVNSPASVFLEPAVYKKKVIYTYVVEPGINWINLLYNDDIVLRYRLKIKNKKD
jgi:hypothetical protein